MKLILAPLVVILLAACQSPQNLAGPKTEDPCDALGYQRIIGTPASELDIATLPAQARVIHPGSAVTMDHRPDRLNVHVDAQGKINSLSCG